MTNGLPRTQHGLVLAGVKATPLRDGLRPALTPAPGEAQSHRAGAQPTTRSTNLKSLRFTRK
jgi:hypothetical protein